MNEPRGEWADMPDPDVLHPDLARFLDERMARILATYGPSEEDDVTDEPDYCPPDGPDEDGEPWEIGFPS